MKIFKIITMLSVTLLICVGCGEFITDSDIYKNFENTTRKLEAEETSNRFFSSAEMYKNAFDRNPNNIDNFNYAIENYNKAMTIVESEDIAENIDDVYIYYNNMGILYLNKWIENEDDITDIDAAIESLKKAVEYDKEEDTVPIENLGAAYYEKWINDFDDTEARDLALSNYELVYEINPNEADINNYLGVFYIDMWEQYGYDEKYYIMAEEYLETALEIDNNLKLH